MTWDEEKRRAGVGWVKKWLVRERAKGGSLDDQLMVFGLQKLPENIEKVVPDCRSGGNGGLRGGLAKNMRSVFDVHMLIASN